MDGVLAVHEFHVWQLAGDRIIASAHIRCRNLSEYMKIAEKVKEFFHNEGIHSTTIQPEFIEIEAYTLSDGTPSLNISGSQDCCALDCPTTEEGCVKATCCQTNNKSVSWSCDYLGLCFLCLLCFSSNNHQLVLPCYVAKETLGIPQTTTWNLVSNWLVFFSINVAF